MAKKKFWTKKRKEKFIDLAINILGTAAILTFAWAILKAVL